MAVESVFHNPSLLGFDDGITRQSAGYAPSVWGDYFIKNKSSSSSTIEKSEDWMKGRVEELVEKVRELLNENHGDLKRLELIDALQRLGIGYHFDLKIGNSLKRILDDGKIDYNDLHAVALRFRLLRQQGYYVKSDVFRKFKDEQGMFKKTLAADVRSLLSLYEACFMATHDDVILDEALIFAKQHLQNSISEHVDACLKMLVSRALELPLQRRIFRLETRYYIQAYEEGREQCNDIILELAKLDFHLLQLLHYQEAKYLSIWWERICQANNFDFTRDRIVECYFWMLSVYYEPQYSTAREITTKVMALMSITDDIYDAYGTYEELKPFTDVITRWDLEAAEQLQSYMKIQFQNITKTFEEFEDVLGKSGQSYTVHYLKEILKVVANAWLVEVKWRDERYIPTMKEHLQITTVTTCYNLLSCAAFIGMGDLATKEAFEWVLTFPTFTCHAATICRLRDDVTSHEFEQKRLHVVSAVECYMKENNCTSEKACEVLLELVENEWKSLNHEYLTLSSTFPSTVLLRVINLARAMETLYDVEDKYTNSSLIKDHISKILIEPISF